MFQRPLRYLSEREALWIADRNLNLSRSQLRQLQIEIVFRLLLPYISSAMPAWSVTSGDKTIYIAQEELVLGSLYYPSFRLA
jgi:hypothetical protein